MSNLTPEDWEEEVTHLQELKKRYDELVGTPGVNPLFALAQINLALVRYGRGERSPALFAEMQGFE